MRINRMLTIIIMLLNRDRITARELAEKFEVSIRTIYRDIEAINLAGIPIISYSGNNGGFGIMENYKIDRQLLTSNDMLSILTALTGISTAFEDNELDSAIEKIKNLIPQEKTDEMNLHFEQIAIDILPWGYGKKQKDNLKTIHRSLVANKLLKFVYRNTKGEKVTRIVEPMTLLLKGYLWYLFAFCRRKNNYRLFRLSRISNLKCLEQNFTRRDASYKDYIKTENDAPKIAHLVLVFQPEMRFRVEDYFDEEHIHIHKNGYLVVKVSYPEDEWVYSFILSYGEYVEVLEPLHIRKIIQEKAKKIASIYKPDIMVSQG